MNNNKSNKMLYAIIILSTILITGIIVLYFYDTNSSSNNNQAVNNNQTNNHSNAKNDNNEDENEQSISIAVSGDIMFHDDQLTDIHKNDNGNYHFEPFFQLVKPYFQEADLAIANFETTTSGKEPYIGYPLFNSPDESISAIQNSAIDVLITANNHSLDTEEEGLRRTASMMEKEDMDYVGTYKDKPSDDNRYLMKDVNGLNVAILAYTESTNGNGDAFDQETLDSMINIMEEEQIKRDIEQAKSDDADLIIAYMHWGIEYDNEPNDVQEKFAQLLADEGVHIILGSHPHVIQPSTFLDAEDFSPFVIYSLGNFVSNQREETLGSDRVETEDGVIVQLDATINKETKNVAIDEVNYVPTWVHRFGEEGAYKYEIVPIEEFLDDKEYKDVKERMQSSYERTMDKLETK